MTLIVLVLAGTSIACADTPVLIPDLVGNWTGTDVGYERGAGYYSSSTDQIILSIMEQNDRVFNGTFTAWNPVSGKVYEIEDISGVIGPDMKSIYLAEFNGGYDIGQIIDTDTLELLYLKSGENAMACIDTFTRDTAN